MQGAAAKEGKGGRGDGTLQGAAAKEGKGGKTTKSAQKEVDGGGDGGADEDKHVGAPTVTRAAGLELHTSSKSNTGAPTHAHCMHTCVHPACTLRARCMHAAMHAAMQPPPPPAAQNYYTVCVCVARWQGTKE